MTVVALIAVCVVAALGLGFGIGRRRRASRRGDPGSGERIPTSAEVGALRSRLRDAEAALHRAEATHTSEVASLRTRLGEMETHANLSAVATAPPAEPGPVIEALWDLQVLGLDRDRRRAVWLTAIDREAGGPIGLAEALATEVSRIREDVGTPSEIETDLGVEPPAHVALLVLRSAEATLDVLARRAEALTVHLAHEDTDVAVTIVCRGAGDDPLADGDTDADTEAIDRAIRPAGGRLDLDHDEDGRVRARLRLPSDQG